MNELSCDMCMDLIPLVKDGVASDDSVKAVQAHIAACETCRAIFNGDTPPQVDAEKSLEKIYKKLRLSSAAVMMFGIFFGLGLTSGSDLFYNAMIMPIIGALGYFVFRWRALYTVPVLLLVTQLIMSPIRTMIGAEHTEFAINLTWIAIYSLFTVAGTMVALLLHFAFRKDR